MARFANSSSSSSDSAVCPFCGAPLPRKAKACRECGSDEATGWSEGAAFDNGDLPEEHDYAESLEKEFPGLGPKRKKPFPWMALIGGGLLLFFVAGYVLGCPG